MALKRADFRWNEVGSINCYALFMGYQLMAVRGLGYLVLLWSTVVLLGGFVSMLEKKDFWSLTIITLVLTPRVSDVGLKQKLKYILEAIHGLSYAIFSTLYPKSTDKLYGSPLLLGVVVWWSHLLVAPIVVCPLAALYLCGPLFSAGISLWRLIEHDYHKKKTDGDAHLWPALIVLYSLAVLQGLLFCYRVFSSFARKGLVNSVAEGYKMSEHKELVKEYLRETVTRCEKDPAFFKERNLATYAVELIKSDSSESFVSGARIMDALLKHALMEVATKATLEEEEEQQALIAELIGLVSSTHVLEKLLQVLDYISPHDETTRMRELAANIMVHLASRTRVMQFPQVIQRIGSLLQISQQQCEESAAYMKLLMEKGLVILAKLAEEENCRAIDIIHAQGLLSKVLAPLSFDLLHLVGHEEWSTVVIASLQVMCRLVSAPGETGAQLRSQIASNKDAIHGMEVILKCCGCGDKLHILTVKILTQLPMDEPSGVNMESRGNYIKMLPSFFTDATKPCSIRELAGEEMVKLSQNESDAGIILKANDYIVHDLTNILLLDVVDNNTKRIIAAKTLKHLYIHYKENDDYFNTLKKTLEGVVPKVLREIRPVFGFKGKETQLAENGTDKHSFLLPGATDIEAQEVGDIQDDSCNINTCTHQQNEARKLQAGLLSLVQAIFDKLIFQHDDLAQLFDKISPGDSAVTFANKLMEMVRTNNEATESCLSIIKSTSKMVISMMKHNDNCLKEDFLKTFIQSMSKGCKTMSCLEGSIVLDIGNRVALKPHRTLASLVREAQELLVTKEPKER